MYSTIVATLYRKETGEEFDITDTLIAPLKWYTDISLALPGRLTFSVKSNTSIEVGDVLSLNIDGIDQFQGMVRTKKRSRRNIISCIAYDNKFLLKSKEIYNFGVMTASERFSVACDLLRIPNVIRQGVAVPLGEYISDGKSMYEVIQDGIEETYRKTGERYAIKDSFGTLEFFSLNHLVTETVIGHDSLLTDWELEHSIEDLINSVKITKEDAETKERLTAHEADGESMKLFGVLQDVRQAENNEDNLAQMQEQAREALKEQNKPKVTFSLDCVGHFSVVAGNTVFLDFEELQKRPALVTRCAHTFGESHEMRLDVEVI